MSCASAEALQQRLLQAPTPLQRLHLPVFAAAGVELWLKREDLRHPLLGGNKWPKLLGHLRAAEAAGQGTLVSFGGAWSNHLHALAAAGRELGLSTVGLVRGDRDTAMLADCRRWGMRIVSLSHGDYRRRDDTEWLQGLLAAEGLSDSHVIPEGGGGAAGLEGFAGLAAELAVQAGSGAVLAVAMGTGTTARALAGFLPADMEVWGFPVLPLKAAELAAQTGLRFWPGQVDKAYGRLGAELRRFLHEFEGEQGIALDPVYTVKLLYALHALAEQGRLPRATRIVALHSGGLQGRRGHALSFAPALAA
jgi:1-aminocyclopropane-1-carboxylate deaminase